MNVYQKLQAARIELQNTALKKSGHNKFAGYHYFELGDFLPTIQTIFAKHGLCGAVSFDKELANLTITNADKPEEQISFCSPMADAQLKGCHPIQNLGAVETYQRRYLWVTAMEIVEHDALDATAGSEPNVKAIKPAKGVIKGTDGEMERLTEEERAQAITEADYIKEAYADGRVDDAFAEWQSVADELKVAVWGMLTDSTLRSTLKRMNEEAKAA